NKWEQLYDRLVRREGLEILPPPTEIINSALERVEKLFHTPLPQSYKEFIHLFGPGEIGGYFDIFGPAIEGFQNWGNSLEDEIRAWKDPNGVWATEGKPDLVARLMCFSSTIGGDGCFWDPQDVRDPNNHEYGIYVLSRDAVVIDVTLI